ncbi:MAG: hypothetical protein EZS28_028856 [Streblomastix strix]|uniref:Uncharacterized protein n=1 Tax=Streblomastix strix TaxID=222440 RepID=A0A5J4UZ42_9EUKA|nr:MAG: hypothetical protein EZS28_028856 [Streblomastix strix]
MLIPPISAYPQQQISRKPLLSQTTEKNQWQRQSQKSISPTHKSADESEDEDFLDEIIPGITMPHLPLHKTDIETAQRTWQNRGYVLVRDPIAIKYKNSKWHSKLAIQKLFIFRDWREFWSDACFSLEQINIPHYLSKEYKSQSPHDQSRRNESMRIYEKEWQYAIDNGKGMKSLRLEEQLLEAEAKKKQNNSRSRSSSSSSSSSSSNSSSSSSSNNLEIQKDWTGKGNTEVP